MNAGNKELAERLDQIGLQPDDLSDDDWVTFLAGRKRLCVEWIKIGIVGDKEARLKRVRLLELET